MKKIISIAILSLLAMAFNGCQKDEAQFVGYWLGEANMIFEVIKDGDNYIIRNINGDLSAKVSDGALRGKNSLDMEYVMRVKGDSAYYEFGSITTGYKRISKSQYDEIFATQKKIGQD
jgi:hypothetical protein